MDDVVIEAARGNRECSPFVDAFPRPGNRDPVAVLYVEYQEASAADVESRFSLLRETLRGLGGLGGGGATGRRSAGAISHECRGDGRGVEAPQGGGTAVARIAGIAQAADVHRGQRGAAENLGRFVRELKRIVAQAGTRAAFWAHASVGVLHVRPMLNPHDEGDMIILRRIAREAADLARDCGGVMSGEHGDGRVRGPLLEQFFGSELMTAFREIKAIFDPRNLMNPGNIVAPGPIESITERTRIQPEPGELARYHRPEVTPIETYFDYTDQQGFDHAVEMCNGSGVCRKMQGGSMCPSYRATLDERHSTRGRGNALRLAITGQLTPGSAAEQSVTGERWADAATIETLSLCLSCKACKTECPSNVDIARLKAEYTAQRYRAKGRVPMAVWLTGHVRGLNRLGALMPGIANWGATLPPVRWAIGKVMGLHPARRLPSFSRSLFAREREFTAATIPPSAPRVALFGDCFTAYNESDIGVAAGRVLSRLGYQVVLPRMNGGCCGRSMISVGMLEQAIETIDATLSGLRSLIEDDHVRAIVFVEPSCLSAVRDDWLQLRCRTPIALRKALAAKAMLVEDFVDRQWDAHPNRVAVEEGIKASGHQGMEAGAGTNKDIVLLHGHCHQKALWGAETSARALRRVLGDRLKVLDTGCCGMAGSFGYDRDKFDLSMKIARLPAEQGGLVPQLNAQPSATITAPGTSCRHQVHDTTGRRAVHPIEILAEFICLSLLLPLVGLDQLHHALHQVIGHRHGQVVLQHQPLVPDFAKHARAAAGAVLVVIEEFIEPCHLSV